jgi:serine/threonine protein kinase
MCAEIVPVHKQGMLADGRPYYTMKLVCGETLARRLAAADEAGGRRLERLRIFEQVCQGVAYAHARGVIHRDLKPQNIMVGEHGGVQIMDWGLAKSLTAGPLADRQWQAPAISSSDGETGASRHALSTRPYEAFGTAG